MKKLNLIMVLAILTIAPSASADREFSFDKERKFDVNSVAMVRIDMPSGDIKIEKAKGSQIEIQFKNLVRARGQEEADKINEKCEYDAKLVGDELEINVDSPRGHRRDFLDKLFSGDWNERAHIMLRLSIPDGKSVKIDASSTDIDISGLKLDLDVRGSSSDIEMESTEGNFECDLSSGDVNIMKHGGDIRITGKSSDIRMDEIRGEIDIRTSSGDGKIDDVRGSAVISTSSGDYRIYNVDGNLDIRSSSGDINVDSVTGSVRAESSSGDVRLKSLTADQGDFDVDTVSGDVYIEINPNFAGRLSLRSSSGGISSQVSGEIETVSDSKLIASVGAGNGRLKVITSSGDIRVTRY